MLLPILLSVVSLAAARPDYGQTMASNLVGDVWEGFHSHDGASEHLNSKVHSHDGLPEHPASHLHDNYHSHDGLPMHLVTKVHDNYHSHDGLSEHPVSQVHDDTVYHVHDGLVPHPVEEEHTDVLGRRFGFPSEGGDMSEGFDEYNGFSEDYYNSERSGEDSPFDDPFFNNFKPKEKKKPSPQHSGPPQKRPSTQHSSPRQKRPKLQQEAERPTAVLEFTTPAIEFSQQKKPTEQLAAGGAKKNNNGMIREFTLMISKLLFQLSQMKE